MSEDGVPSTVANDDIANATPMSGGTWGAYTDVSQATTRIDDPYCSGRRGSVWYRFTAIQAGQATISLAGSTYDAAVAVYSGSPGSLMPAEYDLAEFGRR